MESLSRESRALYDLLRADTTEIYEIKFAAYKKEMLDVVKVFVNNTELQITEIGTTLEST